MGWLLLGGATIAAECPLDHGIYTEASSGAVLAFHPKTAQHGIMTSGVFELTLPNLKQGLAGEITWTAGRNSRPYGSLTRHVRRRRPLRTPGPAGCGTAMSIPWAMALSA
ncbi:hypothetical protein [Devosia sp.]|uniref:hypothetical protein n=1 Tax=Devosia sp. TaxID=1871048 RepID=UPI00262D9B4C|nr:hypothetical protein [Devosia sp.]